MLNHLGVPDYYQAYQGYQTGGCSVNITGGPGAGGIILPGSKSDEDYALPDGAKRVILPGNKVAPCPMMCVGDKILRKCSDDCNRWWISHWSEGTFSSGWVTDSKPENWGETPCPGKPGPSGPAGPSGSSGSFSPFSSSNAVGLPSAPGISPYVVKNPLPPHVFEQMQPDLVPVPAGYDYCTVAIEKGRRSHGVAYNFVRTCFKDGKAKEQKISFSKTGKVRASKLHGLEGLGESSMGALRGLSDLADLGACGCHPGGDCCDKCRGSGVHGLGADLASGHCTPWKFDGQQYVRHCKDDCGRGMVQYADRNMRSMNNDVKERGYGDSCGKPSMFQSIFGSSTPSVPVQASASPYIVQHPNPITHYGEAIPPDCMLWGIKNGKRYLLCPDKKGRMKKMLGDVTPNSSAVEPFVWLGLTALGLFALTRKKK